MEEKSINKKKKGSIILIWILLILVIGMASYIVYDIMLKEECIKKENIDLEEENEKIEYLDIYSNLVQKLYNNTHTNNCNEDTTNFYRNGSVSIDSFKSNAFYMAYEILLEEKGTIQSGNWKKLDSFTYDELNQKAKLIFGKEFNIENKKYDLCPYQYDSATKTYTFDEEGGCGCTTGPDGPHMTLYQATKSGNQIDIYESVVYQKYSEASIYYNYYKDPLYNQKISDDSCVMGYSTKKCIDNSTKYKFTFTLEEDNYILASITKAN